MSVKVGIIEYGMGNVRSVYNALEVLGADAVVCSSPTKATRIDKVILPGVGAFGCAIENLCMTGWVDWLHEKVWLGDMHFLGICLGLQVIAEESSEHGLFRGLGWIRGVVRRFPEEQKFRIPHIGWNDVQFFNHSEGLSRGLGETETFYFMHSYYLDAREEAIVKGVCNYCAPFTACLQKNNIAAVQFHPEKSQKAGLKVLSNFLE